MADDRLASRLSDRPANLKFQNCTKRKVDVKWVDYDGVAHTFFTLSEGESMNILSFVDHIWVVQDSVTWTLYQANLMSYYEVPSPPTLELTVPDHTIITFIRPVRITYPLLSLREIAGNSTREQLPIVLLNRPRINIPQIWTNDLLKLDLRNMTDMNVNLIWVRPDGQRQLSCMVDAQFEVLYVMSWVGHVWLAEESLSGDRMLIDGKSTYVVSLPQPQHPLLITAPLPSLVQLARKALRRAVYLSRAPVRLEHELPATLLRDLGGQ